MIDIWMVGAYMPVLIVVHIYAIPIAFSEILFADLLIWMSELNGNLCKMINSSRDEEAMFMFDFCVKHQRMKYFN